MKKKHVSVYLSEKEYSFLKKAAAQEEFSVSGFMRNIIREMLSESNLRKHLMGTERRSDHFSDDMG